MTPIPLWPGYDDASEDDLLVVLESKVDAALDSDEPTVDETLARSFATAIKRNEELKRDAGASDFKPGLHRRAGEISDGDVGSWRPK